MPAMPIHSLALFVSQISSRCERGASKTLKIKRFCMLKLTVFWISIMYGGVRGTPMNAISVSIAKIFTLEKSIIFRFFKALNMFFVSFFQELSVSSLSLSSLLLLLLLLGRCCCRCCYHSPK